MIYDFSGFPKELYSIKYPAKGSVEVASKLQSMLKNKGIESKLDEIHILKGELPMEVNDLEDEIQGLHARKVRIEEEINGVNEFIEKKKEAIKEAQALIKKYEKQRWKIKLQN